MKLKRAPAATPSRGGRSARVRISVVALLVISMIAPIAYFSSSSGRTDFSDGRSVDGAEKLFSKEVLDVIIRNSREPPPLKKRVVIGGISSSLVQEETENKESLEQSEQVHSEDESPPGDVNSEREEPKTEIASHSQTVEGNETQSEDPEKEHRKDEADRQKQENEAILRSKEVNTTVLGRYSIWRRDDTENTDTLVRLIRDQLIMARVFASLAQARNNHKLLRDLNARIRDSQRAVDESTTDNDLPTNAPEKIRAMGKILTRARQQNYDCNAIVRRLRAMLQAAEDHSHSLKKQSTFLSQLAAKTMPKGLHCLSLRLNVEYNMLPPEEREMQHPEKLEDNGLYHYALFSDNILAAAVVVNSTVIHAKEPEKHVFHLVTDRLNFAAMKMWFLANPPGEAAIHVENIDDFKWLNASYCPVLRQLESSAMKEYYFRQDQAGSVAAGSSNLKYRNPKYLSMLNHLRFYLPQIYPRLNKILFLDDDVVVQRDLTPLWDIDLQGKVNGAVETCGASFHRFDKYLNFSNPHIARNFDPNACGWAYGMNIFDLEEWNKRDITGIYHKWQTMNEDRTLWKLGTLPPGLITFYNLTYSLDKSWHVLGLGYNPGVDREEIDAAAVIHYNGNLKPWLEIGLYKFKPLWSRYVKYNHPFLQECNIQ